MDCWLLINGFGNYENLWRYLAGIKAWGAIWGGVRSSVANLNFGLKNEITRINSVMAESIEEILTKAIIV